MSLSGYATSRTEKANKQLSKCNSINDIEIELLLTQSAQCQVNQT